MARPVIHDESLRRKLLDTAAILIARDGGGSASLRSIAAAAGTSTTAVYSLYGGKAELLTAVLDDGFASFAEAQQEAASAGLEALGRAYRTWALKHPVLYGLMFNGVLASRVPCRPTPGAAEPSIAPLFAAVAAALPGAADDEVASMVGVVWGQVHGLVSLELAGVPAPGRSWDAAYDAALRQIGRSLGR
ncbi:TetR/AcrR family transcriptional regulator [Arthrobacter sp. Soil763]|uniref:TetR/AcrR family transcriptional regulator n=1 Tax=Arthrobacter sp. Soil763 TaxID=1736402 RepID=UPI0006FE868C|nr:TetR-like C-terminal domain-containing protein [Arthrobacter sp. Soil763]KRE79772.1 TetR family transcriptional regulator [Arthrobacter sp. Soil763]